jgi:arylsulfatase A-like enzyme
VCNLPKKDGLEGIDIMPLLKNPKQTWDYPSITTFGKDNHTIRTERWRYIQYSDKTEELYDHDNDPYEWKNLALDPEYADIKKKLAARLPKINAKPLLGERRQNAQGSVIRE